MSPPGIENLKKRGLAPTPADAALREADAAVLAVPDNLIGRIAAGEDRVLLEDQAWQDAAGAVPTGFQPS